VTRAGGPPDGSPAAEARYDAGESLHVRVRVENPGLVDVAHL
jgi:hypothetical protein